MARLGPKAGVPLRAGRCRDGAGLAPPAALSRLRPLVGLQGHNRPLTKSHWRHPRRARPAAAVTEKGSPPWVPWGAGRAGVEAQAPARPGAALRGPRSPGRPAAYCSLMKPRTAGVREAPGTVLGSSPDQSSDSGNSES